MQTTVKCFCGHFTVAPIKKLPGHVLLTAVNNACEVPIELGVVVNALTPEQAQGLIAALEAQLQDSGVVA